ncbi:MAG: Ig-like domain-containing protein [Candidatus Micrarchaeia archaeon]
MNLKKIYKISIFIIILLIIFQGCAKKDTTKPTVIIAYPSNNQIIYEDKVKIEVKAQDDVEVAKVEFYIDGVNVGTDNISPYEYEWDVSNLEVNSTHKIKAKAIDTSNNIGESAEITVTIGDQYPPTVNILNPKNGDHVKGTIEILINAVDYSSKNLDKIISKIVSGLERVELYIDDILKQEYLIGPYKYIWDTTKESNGSHIIKVIAKDKGENKQKFVLM